MRSTLTLLLILAMTPLYLLEVDAVEIGEVGTGVQANGADEAHYTDRLGYLRRNQKKRDNPAPYVLTDRWGTVRYYVSTKDQVDLEPFLNHHVAIRGDAYQRSHRFDVEEVIPLDTKDIPPLKKAKGPTQEKSVSSSRSRGASSRAEPDRDEGSPERDSNRRSATQDSNVKPARFDEPSATVAKRSRTTSTSPGLRNAVNRMKRPRTFPAGMQEDILTPQGTPVPQISGPMEMMDSSDGIEGEIIGVYPEDGFDSQPELLEMSDEAEMGPFCGLGWWHGNHGPCGTCDRCWIHTEYLLWSTQGMRAPPLVTQSPAGTARGDAGVLGTNGVQVLFGGRHLDQDAHSGVRVRAGFWFLRFPNVGMEGEYWGLSEENANFQISSTGNPIIGRPFFDAFNGRETAELVAFPAILSGTVTVDAITDLQSAGGRLIFAGCCDSNSCIDECDPCRVHPRTRRVDWLLGYRYLQLDDTLAIREDLVSQDPANPGSFLLRDTFDTRNQFNGGEFGVMCGIRRCCWSLDLLSKLAIGNNHQRVTINGTTNITQAGVTTNHVGGLLAQRTNIGIYERDQLSLVPELGLTLGCQITPRLRGTIGYSFIYWSNVVRPGDQIDRDINPNLLPVENPIQTTHLRPEFVFHETDMWIQGFNAGLDLRW